MSTSTSSLTLFARQEATTDCVAIQHGLAAKKDVVLYRDKGCTQPAGRYSWYLSGKPRSNSKSVMLNCFRWNLQWVH